MTRLPRIGAALALALSLPGHAADVAKGLAYVSNQEGGVTVIDLATMQTIQDISSGDNAPRGLGITADGKLLVTANRDGGDLSVIDRVSGKLLRNIHIGKNPEFVRVRGDMAFVSFEPSSTGGPPPKPGSKEAAAEKKERDEEKSEPAHIAIVDLKKGKVVRQIQGGLETEGIEFSANGKSILISNEADNTISVHEISTGRLVRTIDTKQYGLRPRGIKMAPDGSYYVASLEFGNKLLLLDPNYDPIKTVPTGEVPYGLAFDRKGERLFVALSRGKALQVFDTKTMTPIASVPTGDRCWHFSFTPDDSGILVACGRSNEVVVIDAKTLQPLQHIADKKLPWGIVTWPKSLGSLDVP